jgi:hypothetical protein
MAGLVRAWLARPKAGALEPGRRTDVTVLDARRLGVRELIRLIGELGGQDPRPVVRLEADWTAPAWDAQPWIAAAESLKDAEEAPFFVHGIVDHRRSLTPEIEQAIARLADLGIPLSAEIWLQRGVNDSVEMLRELIGRLLHCRVRPYYLAVGEWLADEQRVAPAEAEKLVRGLRGWISGTGVPQWVRVSESGARTAVVPDYLRRVEAAEVTLEDFRGVARVYRNPTPAR